MYLPEDKPKALVAIGTMVVDDNGVNRVDWLELLELPIKYFK